MKKVVLSVVAVIAAVAAFYVAQGFCRCDASWWEFGFLCSPSRAAFQTNERRAASATRQGNTLRYDSGRAGKPVHYVYTLVNLSGADVDRADFMTKVKPTLVNGYKNLPAMEGFRKGAGRVALPVPRQNR